MKEIIEEKENWLLFEPIFACALSGENRTMKHTAWIVKFNTIRNIAAHKNALRTYSDEDLELVDWLRAEVEPKIDAELERT